MAADPSGLKTLLEIGHQLHSSADGFRLMEAKTMDDLRSARKLYAESIRQKTARSIWCGHWPKYLVKIISAQVHGRSCGSSSRSSTKTRPTPTRRASTMTSWWRWTSIGVSIKGCRVQSQVGLTP